ncbi:MAG: hypothetical protein WA936_03350 [Erythrobacter sp.]|uniref:hypothetical protein n=1 Tax=Erythrobacter sp. TaxID=1042 RepID=UPI003C7754C6
MSYQPSFGVGGPPQLAAVLPASLAGAASGLSLLLAFLVFSAFPFSTDPGEVAGFLAFAGFAIVFMLLGASLITGAMLLVVGLPIAWALGDRIRERWSIAIVCLSAIVASFLPASLTTSFDSDANDPLLAAWPALIFALPAAFFYRYFIIQEMENLAE